MRREFKKKSKVLLIDDNYEHLVGIRELLNLEGTFDVVGIATNITVGLNLIKKYQPDIVLLDMNMPEKDGLQGIMEIAKLDLGTKVLALSGYDDADLIFRAMKVGAKGYVLKTMASAQLIYAIEEVLGGKIYLPLALSSRFFEYFQQSFREETAKQAKNGWGMGDWRTDILQAEQRKSFQEEGEGKRGKHQIMLDFVSQVCKPCL